MKIPAASAQVITLLGDEDEFVRSQAIAAAVNIFNDGLAEARDGIAQAVAMMPPIKPIAEMLKTVRVNTEDKTVTVEIKAKTNVLGVFGLILLILAVVTGIVVFGIRLSRR